MSRLVVSLLGPPQIERDGKPIQVRTRKAIALLAYLAVTNTSQTRDTLDTLFWPESDQVHARGALRVTLSSLKKALGDEWLEVDRESVALAKSADLWLDVEQFNRRLAECSTHGHAVDKVCPSCLTPLSEAVALYRDDFMAGFSLRDSPGFEDWQLFKAENIRFKLSDALGKLVRCYSARAEFEPAILYAQRWLALDPLHEPAHRYLMQLYAWVGQRAAALRQYRDCVQVLGRELGLPPQEETVRLCSTIREDTTPSPPVPTLPAKPSAWWRARHLPPPAYTQLFGVEETLNELLERLKVPHDHWIVSLEGMGGLGKTALAREAASRLAETDRFAGIAWCDLKSAGYPAADLEDVLDTIIEQLGDSDLASFSLSTKRDHLRALFKEFPYLVVVDGLEAAKDFDTLPNLLWELARPTKFLLTSRRRGLRCSGLSTLPIDELSESEGMALLRYEGYRQGLRELTGTVDQVLRPLLSVTSGNPQAIKLVISQLLVLPPDKVLCALREVQSVAAPLYQDLFLNSWTSLSQKSKRLLFSMAELPHSTGDWNDLLAISSLSEADLVSAVAELTNHSLLQAQGVREKSYSIHRLTLLFVRSRKGWDEV